MLDNYCCTSPLAMARIMIFDGHSVHRSAQMFVAMRDRHPNLTLGFSTAKATDICQLVHLACDGSLKSPLRSQCARHLKHRHDLHEKAWRHKWGSLAAHTQPSSPRRTTKASTTMLRLQTCPYSVARTHHELGQTDFGCRHRGDW